MKLLRKLTNRYIAWSILVMIVSGIAIYVTLSVITNNQMDERLTENLDTVEKQLTQKPETIFFEPVALVEKITEAEETVTFSDTLIYNENENELEDYRQISAVKNINGEFYHIVLRKSKIESEDFLTTLVIVISLGMIMLWLILFWVAQRITQSIWQPFFLSLKKIEEFSVTDKVAVNLEKTGIYEFDQLNSVADRLTSQIITDFQNQKQFSEDISHELQTPLAVVISHLESLLGDPTLNEHSKTLNSIYASVRHLSKLNKAMILLSKIENNQFAWMEETDLKEVMITKLEEFSELINLKKLQLETHLDNALLVHISPSLAEILINNLLSNSINHTTKGGKIKISFSDKRMVICNTGTEQIVEPKKLFDRFYKGDSSSQSVGLGLAIVKKICDLHKLEIRYQFNEGLHCFELTSLN